MQRMRRELQQQLERETALRNDVAALQQKLSDANQGIRAAARLSDQLEAGQQTIAVLRDEGECKTPKGYHYAHHHHYHYDHSHYLRFYIWIWVESFDYD